MIPRLTIWPGFGNFVMCRKSGARKCRKNLRNCKFQGLVVIYYVYGHHTFSCQKKNQKLGQLARLLDVEYPGEEMVQGSPIYWVLEVIQNVSVTIHVCVVPVYIQFG